MKFEINGRDIVQSHTQIGFQGDNNVETLEFRLPKWSSGEELSQGVAILLYRLSDGSTGYMPMEMHTESESLVLVCKVSKQLTALTGNVDVQLKISGLDEELWHSEITTFQIAKSLPIEGLPLVKMTLDGTNAVLDDDPPITIAERKINIPANLQNIAVQNDQNSKMVTLQMPCYFDGHDLSQHSIYLKTVSDGGRDDVLFSNVTVGNTSLTFEWTLKPPQTSYNGKLNLQLYVIGTDFKWETEPASVNIIRSIDADPVIPMTPPIMDSFIQQLNAIKGQAEGHAQAAAGAAAGAAATATQQANIAKTEADRLVQAGANFKVLGFYDRLEELQTAVSNPERGDAYGVGDNPVHAYVWSGTEWQPGQELGIDLTAYYTKTEVDNKMNNPPAWYIQSNPNLLINGDFQVWQRGTNFTPAQPNTYTADRWKSLYDSNTTRVENTSPAGVKYNIRVTHNGTNSFLITQLIEDQQMFLGKTATLSFYARSNSAKVLHCRVGSDFQLDNITSDWEKFELTFNNIAFDTLEYKKGVSIDSTTFISGDWVEFSAIKLELGDHATPFTPRLIGEELALCQRDYEIIRDVYCGVGTTFFDMSVMYKVTKRIPGTVTIISRNNVKGYASYWDGTKFVDFKVNTASFDTHVRVWTDSSGDVADKVVAFSVICDAGA